MSKFKENDRVELISTESKGKIDKIFPFDDETIYIVRLDSGLCIKCYGDDLKLVEEDTETSDTIVLSRKEFNSLVTKVSNEVGNKIKDPDFRLAISATGVLIGLGLETELFGPKKV